MSFNIEAKSKKAASEVWQGFKRVTGAEAYEWAWHQKQAEKLSPLKLFGVAFIFGSSELFFPATCRSMRYSAEATNFYDRFRYQTATMGASIMDCYSLLFLMSFIGSDLPPVAFFGAKALINVVTDLSYRKLILAE
jgi:hypothetical protein